MPFNEKQQLALDTPLNKNVLISAGAGSGKTAVLSEKVLLILKDELVRSDELLVLTFTDAASFEMKNRIIEKVGKVDKDLATKLYSAHISTFDSFASYLVKKYSDVLGLPPTFRIIEQSIIDIKKVDFLKEILDEYYKKDDDENFRELLKLTCLSSDEPLKDLIINLDTLLDTLGEEEREKYLNNYDFSDETKLNSLLKGLYMDFFDLLEDMKNALINNYSNFSLDPKQNDHFNKVIEVLNEYLKHRGDSLENIAECLFNPLKKSLFPNKPKNAQGYYIKLYSDLKDKIKKARDNVFAYPNIEESKEYFKKFKEPSFKVLEITKKLRAKLAEYKFINSAYTFSDVALLSLDLVKKEKYHKQKEEILSSFKYVLVDEYQDTNDVQEDFLFEISKSCKMFVVGDVKQSIYRFRNANPTLFGARRNLYEKDDDSLVIDMNTNYRSFKGMLESINKVFFKCMSIKTGGVDFNEAESLHYDETANIYDENKLINKEPNFGYLTCNVFRMEADCDFGKQDALMIINDILDKINNHYQVLESSKDGVFKFRDCRFGDFAILASRRYNFNTYKEIFNKYNIPLNIKSEQDIKDINSVIVIQSLLKTYIDLKTKNEKDFKFDFVSLARSYLYEYTDKEVYDKLEDGSYKDDIIFAMMKSFIEYTSNDNIEKLFLKLLDEFGVVTKLNKLGDLDSNLNKIESLYQIASSYANNGNNLENLNELMMKIDKYSIKFTGTNLTQNPDSVEITTIHSSKGLEYKIVYMPIADSNYRYNPDRANLIPTKDYGILYKERTFDAHYRSLYEFVYKKEDKEEDYNEYIRKIYVAFTRAKEKLIFVDSKQNHKNEIYKMLLQSLNCKCFVHKETFDYINSFNFDNKLDFSLFEEASDFLNVCFSDLTNPENYNFYSSYDPSLLVQNIHEFLGAEEDDEENEDEEAKQSDKKIDYSWFTDITSIEDKLVRYKVFEVSEILKEAQSKIFEKVFKRTLNFKLVNELKNTREGREIINISHKEKLSEGDFYLVLIYLTILNDKEIVPLYTYEFLNCTNYNLSRLKEIETYNAFKMSIPTLKTSDSTYEFKKKENRKASHDVEDDEIFNSGILEKGIRLHYLLEMYDFNNGDLSYIENEKEKEVIAKVVNLDIFKNVKNAKIFKEYEYLEGDQKGSIDLLLVYDDHVDIIDYKTKRIDDENYPRQLGIYKDNIQRLFNVDKINTYLVSISDGIYKEIK